MLREHSVENIYVYVKSVKDKQPTQGTNEKSMRKQKYPVHYGKIQNCFIFVCLVERVAQLF